MPKNYMNRAERESVGITKVLVDTIESTMLEHMAPAERKCFKTAKTWYDKFMKELFARVGVAEANKIINDFSGKNIGYKEVKHDGDVVLNEEHLLDLVDAALHKCMVCKQVSGRDCAVRGIFQDLDIPKNTNPVHACPYHYS